MFRPLAFASYRALFLYCEDYQHELFSAPANKRVRVANILRNRLRGLLQDFVSGVMPICVVDALEMIDIDHQATKACAVSLATTDFQRKYIAQLIAVKDTRQWVGNGQSMKFLLIIKYGFSRPVENKRSETSKRETAEYPEDMHGIYVSVSHEEVGMTRDGNHWVYCQ